MPANDASIATAWFSPSLNLVRIARLPGLPEAMVGARAHDWLSSMGIARRMAERGLADGLPPVGEGVGPDAIIPAGAYAVALDAMLDGSIEALDLADDLGAALAALIATLVLGPADARAARPDWPDAHWARWARVRRIALGGGIVSGRLGARMRQGAIDRLPAYGAADLDLRLAADPETLVLRGVAARLPDGRVVLVDAGHTSIKPAIALVAAGRPAAITRSAPIPTSAVLSSHRGAALADRLADIAAEAAGAAEVAAAGFAIAAYTDADGQPIPGPGAYPSLAEVPLAARLAARLEERLGRPVLVSVAGDGESAAAAVRGEADAAIVLGTAIGSGLNV